MTKEKKIDNYQKFDELPEHLKKPAIEKAVKTGYTEQEAKKLFFNNDGQTLIDGMIDKKFKFS